MFEMPAKFEITVDHAEKRTPDFTRYGMMVMRMPSSDTMRLLSWAPFDAEDIAEIRAAGGDEAADAAVALNEMMMGKP